MSRGRVSGGGESSEDRLNKIRVHLEKRVIDLECDIAQLRESSRTPAACGHMQNFQIGDECGHFSCLVCENQKLREDNLNLVNSLELEGHRIENLARENAKLREQMSDLSWRVAGDRQ